MSQEIEIEFKNLLTEAEFNRLLNVLPFPKNARQQINYYFETNNRHLKQSQTALRIRKINNEYRLTIKEPHPEGLLETHDMLTKQEAHQWLNGSPTQTTNVFKRLQANQIDLNDLNYYGQLTTDRWMYETESGAIVVLDYSVYNGHVDYELEVESPTRELGTKVFKYILNNYEIVKKSTPNKIERFFSTLT